MPASEQDKLGKLQQEAIEVLKGEHSARNMMACIMGCLESMTSTEAYDEEFMALTNEAVAELIPFIEKLCAVVHEVKDAK
jgi:DNA repair ATPase RecN